MILKNDCRFGIKLPAPVHPHQSTQSIHLQTARVIKHHPYHDPKLSIAAIARDQMSKMPRIRRTAEPGWMMPRMSQFVSEIFSP